MVNVRLSVIDRLGFDVLMGLSLRNQAYQRAMEVTHVSSKIIKADKSDTKNEWGFFVACVYVEDGDSRVMP